MDEPTLVVFTVDVETNWSIENGFWSWAVNGRMPADLDEWIRTGAATLTPERTFRIVPEWQRLVPAFRDLDTPAPRIDRADWLATADGGLPLLLSRLEDHGMRATLFVDVSGLYRFGRADFETTLQLAAGHEIATHLHMPTLFGRWLRDRDIPDPPAVNVLEWGRDTLDPAISRVTADLAGLASERPVSYRAGAYRANDALIDALAAAGYRVDSSYDRIHADHHRLNLGRVGNEPVPYRGLLEAPITTFRLDGKLRRLVPPFGGAPDDLDRRGLELLRGGGCTTVNYIFHSYDLMTIDRDSGTRRYLPRNNRLCGWLDRTLDWIAGRPDDFQIVTFRELADRYQGSPLS